MQTDPDGTPRGPLTYVISYAEENSVSDSWADQIRTSPPDLLHHGHDVPLNNLWGPTKGLSGWKPDHAGTPADVRAKIERLRGGIDRLHGFGVRWVIPYINASIIGGNPDTPAGFFHFWRRRHEFAEFGLDRLPESDPMDWMQRNWFPFEVPADFCPYQRYEPCLRRESWLGYVEIVAGLIAEAGYDGLFSDDDLVHCYCPQCMADFRAFLREEYAGRIGELEARLSIERTMLYSDDGKGTGPAMRRPTSGKLNDGPPFIEGAPADPWATLVWEASQAFWSHTVGEMLVRLRDSGRQHNPKFFIVANWGMSRSARPLGIRRRLGHNFRRWQPGAVWQMLEEDGSCGYVAPGLVVDLWTSCRVVKAHGGEPALLAYTRGGAGQQQLTYAEVASACCGALCDQYGTSDLRNAYRTFYQERSELFSGAVPYAPVGLYYSFDDITRNNDDHLGLFYAASRALGRSHIPFNVVTAANLFDLRPEVLINPGASDVPTDLPDGTSVITVGPGGHKPESVLSTHEIAIDRVLDSPWRKQQEALAGWTGIDLSAPAPLAGVIRRATAYDLALTQAREAHAVRLRAYLVPADRRLVVHVVNYGSASMAESIPAPGRAPQFPLTIPPLRGWNIESAWTEGPEVPRQALPISRASGEPRVNVPPTDVYRVVVVQYR